ncbi:OmpP1/FadL family transporter [Flavobacterium sp.]|jgi:long-subunit fatty acid transport protein|uniref:OmpP1/FadL family transporter n=1 Tax=Flavobacterium sp. TaxID=239 RepID=UPI002A8308B2|nr:outer membrane protein transport protein [Flavobacterium sp.]
MKKILFTILISSSLLGFSQETTIQDALRYSIDNLNGTARFRGMSGAFGAVGGDLSALNINPAGSVIFANNYASITATNYNKYNKSNYFNTTTKETYGILDINQIGAVLVFNSSPEENNGWNKIAIALNYENTNNFDNNIFSAGINPNNSIGNYFINFAQGLPLSNLQLQSGESISSLYNYLGETGGLGFPAQQALLGYQGLLFEAFDDNDPNNVDYYTNIPTGGNYYQENYIQSTGYNGKVTANVATAYKDKIFLGMNLNVHFTDYIKTSSLYERNNNPLYSSGLTVEQLQFNNELSTYGSGFSFNLGAIAKVTDDLRLGLAYESSTWYTLNDELTQRLYTSTTDGTTDFNSTIAPNVINIYPTYKIQTPSKWTGSMAYIVNKKGLISVDVITKDYSNTKFKPTNDSFFRGLNNQMSQELNNTIEYRIGGEYKIKQFSVRAGYRFEESPYKVDYAMGDLTGYSGGIGYNFGESKLDLSYSNDHRNYNQSLISSGMNDTARMRQINNNITVTYSVNF